MIKKVLIIINIILLLILIKLVVTFSINENIIANYNNNMYNEQQVQELLALNISEPYIAHYNYGNVLYKNNKFNEAISQYNKALELNPPKDKECSIRINLALAMLKQINEEDLSEQNRENTIEILQDARRVLCKNGCANENDNNGHSMEAEKLKAEIDKKLKELQKDSDDPKEDPTQKQEIEEIKKQIEQKLEQLREIQSQGKEERDDDILFWKHMMEEGYYYGKKW